MPDVNVRLACNNSSVTVLHKLQLKITAKVLIQ